MARELPIKNGRLESDLDANGHRIVNLPAVVTVDSALSATSENPVQNKAVKAALDLKADKSLLSVSGAVYVLDEPLPSYYGNYRILRVPVVWVKDEETGAWNGWTNESAAIYVPPGTAAPGDLLVTFVDANTHATSVGRLASFATPGMVEAVRDDLAASVAPAFSASSAYAVGAAVSYMGRRFVCVRAKPAGRDFYPEDWTLQEIEGSMQTFRAEVEAGYTLWTALKGSVGDPDSSREDITGAISQPSWSTGSSEWAVPVPEGSVLDGPAPGSSGAFSDHDATLLEAWFFPESGGSTVSIVFKRRRLAPAVAAPSTSSSDAGKAADAKATGDALAGKADASALRYALVSPEVTYTTTTTTDDTAAVTLQDRACNKVVLGAGVAECTITFPAAVEGRVRDFIVDVANMNANDDVEVSLSGIDETFAVCVDDASKLSEYLTFAAGAKARLYFTETGFTATRTVDNASVEVPVFEMVRKDVEVVEPVAQGGS